MKLSNSLSSHHYVSILSDVSLPWSHQRRIRVPSWHLGPQEDMTGPVSSLSHRRQSLYIESSECTFLTQNIASPLCTHRHCCQNCTVCSGLDCTQAWVDNLLNFGQTQENLGFLMAKPIKSQPKSRRHFSWKNIYSCFMARSLPFKQSETFLIATNLIHATIKLT